MPDITAACGWHPLWPQVLLPHPSLTQSSGIYQQPNHSYPPPSRPPHHPSLPLGSPPPCQHPQAAPLHWHSGSTAAAHPPQVPQQLVWLVESLQPQEEPHACAAWQLPPGCVPGAAWVAGQRGHEAAAGVAGPRAAVLVAVLTVGGNVAAAVTVAGAVAAVVTSAGAMAAAASGVGAVAAVLTEAGAAAAVAVVSVARLAAAVVATAEALAAGVFA